MIEDPLAISVDQQVVVVVVGQWRSLGRGVSAHNMHRMRLVSDVHECMRRKKATTH